jgi:hypothetical protein
LYGGKIQRIDLSKNENLEVVQLVVQGLPTICVKDLNIDFAERINEYIPFGMANGGNMYVESTAWFKDQATMYSVCE